jgi:hypothetical protein
MTKDVMVVPIFDPITIHRPLSKLINLLEIKIIVRIVTSELDWVIKQINIPHRKDDIYVLVNLYRMFFILVSLFSYINLLKLLILYNNKERAPKIVKYFILHLNNYMRCF